MRKRLLLLLLLFSTGCGYQLGFSKRQLPEGYKQIAIPVFANKTHETGVEVFFTNSLIKEFALSRVAQVVPKSVAPVMLIGQINEIKYVSESQAKRRDTSSSNDDSPVPNLPENTILTTKYRIYVKATVQLKRLSDNKIIWQSPFTGEKNYSAPLLEKEGINSANALYNHNARQKQIASIAETMMVEVHDRISESF